MALTYAGIPLVVPTPDLQKVVDDTLRPEDLNLFEPHHIFTRQRASWSLSTDSGFPRPELGSLYWPVGASRCAVGYFLVTDNQLSQIRKICFSGSAQVPAPLVMSSTKSITTNLWMLPPRPLTYNNERSPVNGLYLLVLVDDRYFWWDANLGTIQITETVTTWDNLLDLLSNALGTTITHDPIPAAYLPPGSSFSSNFQVAAPFLDAIAFNLGMKVVRDLSGWIHLYSAGTSQAILSGNLTNFNVKTSAGGPILGQHIGPVQNPNNTTQDLNSVLPSYLTITFPRYNLNPTVGPDGTAYPITVALGNLSLFPGVAGNAANQTFYDQAVSLFTNATDNTPTNLSDLQNLTTQFAKDWYQNMAGGVDMKFAGIQQAVPEGSDDIIWKYTSTEVTTRFRRNSLNESVEELQHTDFAGQPSPNIISTDTYFTGDTYFTDGGVKGGTQMSSMTLDVPTTVTKPVTLKSIPSITTPVMEGSNTLLDTGFLDDYPLPLNPIAVFTPIPTDSELRGVRNGAVKPVLNQVISLPQQPLSKLNSGLLPKGAGKQGPPSSNRPPSPTGGVLPPQIGPAGGGAPWGYGRPPGQVWGLIPKGGPNPPGGAFPPIPDPSGGALFPGTPIIPGVLPAGPLFYVVTTTVNGVETEPSNEMSVNVPSSGGSVQLQWTPGAWPGPPPSPPITNYNIYWGRSSGAENNKIANIPARKTSFIHTGREQTVTQTPPVLTPGGAKGETRRITNQGPKLVLIDHENVGSHAQNRILTPNKTQIILFPGMWMDLIFDDQADGGAGGPKGRWRAKGPDVFQPAAAGAGAVAGMVPAPPSAGAASPPRYLGETGIWLTLPSAGGWTYHTFSANTTSTDTGNAIWKGTNPATLTLPDATLNSGQVIAVSNAAGAGSQVTVAGGSGQTINGDATQVINNNGSIIVASDGVGWRTIAREKDAQNNGTFVNQRPTLNFLSPGLQAVDNPGNKSTDVSIDNSVPRWVKVTKTFTDFSTAGTGKTLTVYTLPTGGVLHAIKAKATAAFAGGAITTYTISGGQTGNTTAILGSFNVHTVPAFSANSLTNASLCYQELYPGGGDGVITATAISTGANLNAATTGSIDFFLLVSTAN